MALAMIVGMQVANAGAVSASTVGIYWDRTDHTGDSHTWSVGNSSWRCDSAWDGADAETSNVGSTWNDRYSSARIGLAGCGVVFWEHADFGGMSYASPDKTLRYADLTNSLLSNKVTSLTWS